MKVVDTASCKVDPSKSLKVLLGINDQEFQLIQKSLCSRNILKGKFMSPLLALCHQNEIAVDWIGRKLTATSSRLSYVSFFHPVQFYKLVYMLMTKSWSLIRTPQALPHLQRSIPHMAKAYVVEGSECMVLKIRNAMDTIPFQQIVAVIPLENFHIVVEGLQTYQRISGPDSSRLVDLEAEGVGLWLPVLALYILLPVIFSIYLVRELNSGRLVDLSNYETQGIALGTWVRDRRRD